MSYTVIQEKEALRTETNELQRNIEKQLSKLSCPHRKISLNLVGYNYPHCLYVMLGNIHDFMILFKNSTPSSKPAGQNTLNLQNEYKNLYLFAVEAKTLSQKYLQLLQEPTCLPLKKASDDFDALLSKLATILLNVNAV